MTVGELIESLMFFNEHLEVHVDIDDFKDTKLRELTHIYQYEFKDERKPIIIIDADWGKNRADPS